MRWPITSSLPCQTPLKSDLHIAFQRFGNNSGTPTCSLKCYILTIPVQAVVPFMNLVLITVMWWDPVYFSLLDDLYYQMYNCPIAVSVQLIRLIISSNIPEQGVAVGSKYRRQRTGRYLAWLRQCHLATKCTRQMEADSCCKEALPKQTCFVYD